MAIASRQQDEDHNAIAPLEAIDFAHLDRMTLGEVTVEREVLNLFDRQAGMLLAGMQCADAKADAKSVAAHAHTLCGSARGIGAWKVATAAESLERAANERDRSGAGRLLQSLGDAIEEAQALIRDRLKR